MESVVKKENGTLFISVSGRLDTVTSAELKEKLDAEGYENIDVDFDFKEIEYISSAGLRLVLLLHKQTEETGNKLVIRNVGRVVAEIFRVAGFNKALNIV
ncbi:MAG: STAS domain-containing protein [Clostridia bacterium]|nr:STAS domain-containing protein [Clostridia bacterium]